MTIFRALLTAPRINEKYVEAFIVVFFLDSGFFRTTITNYLLFEQNGGNGAYTIFCVKIVVLYNRKSRQYCIDLLTRSY